MSVFHSGAHRPTNAIHHKGVALAQRNMQAAGNFMQELFINADIKDHRVNFF